MQVFQSSPELQKNLNPNLSYGEHHNHDTALHFAAKHGMKHLLRLVISEWMKFFHSTMLISVCFCIGRF